MARSELTPAANGARPEREPDAHPRYPSVHVILETAPAVALAETYGRQAAAEAVRAAVDAARAEKKPLSEADAVGDAARRL
ncbi:MAG: hypothetical protein KAH44_29935, partial [Oricola sp.]|nr:hypothetical protein [Oricola sp.]